MKAPQVVFLARPRGLETVGGSDRWGGRLSVLRRRDNLSCYGVALVTWQSFAGADNETEGPSCAARTDSTRHCSEVSGTPCFLANSPQGIGRSQAQTSSFCQRATVPALLLESTQ